MLVSNKKDGPAGHIVVCIRTAQVSHKNPKKDIFKQHTGMNKLIWRKEAIITDYNVMALKRSTQGKNDCRSVKPNAEV